VTVRISEGANVLCESILDVGNATCYGSVPHTSENESSPGKPAVTGRLGHAVRRVGRAPLAATACVIGLVLLASPAAHAEPAGGPSGGPPPSPFPDANLILRYYDLVRYDDYFTDSVGGVWFSTPLGLNCGIWDRGSFGCTGDIRGAPAGYEQHRLDHRTDRTPLRPGTGSSVFPPGRAQRDLPPA